MYKNYLNKIQRSAEGNRRFSSYNGDAGVAPMKRLAAVTYTLTVVNSTNVDSTYTLFGFNAFESASAGQGEGVTVTGKQTSHEQMRKTSATQPLMMVRLKLKTSNTSQFDQVVTYVNKKATGVLNQIPLTPTDYEEPENQQTDLIRVDNLNWLVDGDTYITGTIESGITLTFTFTSGAQVNLANAAEDTSVVESAGALPTGTKPVELVVADRASQVYAAGNRF